MTAHFGVTLNNKKGGFKLTADNYINESDKDIVNLSYEEIEDDIGKVMNKFNLNMHYFQSLSQDKFNEELKKFVEENNFIEIDDLNSVNGISGYYITVLEDYSQIYIGISHNIRQRIMKHWSKQVPLKQLLLDAESGLLPIDCFRALDTTRVFICIGHKDNFSEDHLYNMPYEDRLICKFPVDYCLNIATLFAGRELFWERRRNLALRDLKMYGNSWRTEELDQNKHRFLQNHETGDKREKLQL